VSAKWRRNRAWDDRVFPPALWPVKALLRALSSIWLAVLTLALVALYLAAGSAPIIPLGEAGELRWVHAWEPLEWTTEQYYSAWPLTALLALFIVNMIVATVRRIEFRWINAGVLTVHAGIVLLAAGAAIDAASRERGELFLPAGSPPEWADRFMVAGEIELFIEAGADRAGLSLAGLPRYRAAANDDGSPLLRWTPPFSGAPELEVFAYTPRASAERALREAEDGRVPVWDLEWRGASGDEAREALPAGSGWRSVIRLRDGTRIEHLTALQDDRWAVAKAVPAGEGQSLLAIASDHGVTLLPVWPGALLHDEGSVASIAVVSVERFSVVPSAIEECEQPVASPALVALIRHGDEPERTVVLLADDPLSSYEILDSRIDTPTVRRISDDPVLSRFGFVDAAAPSVTLRGRQALVRAPGGAVTGPIEVEPGGRLDVGERSTLWLQAFSEKAAPTRDLTPRPRSELSAGEVGTRLDAAISVRAGSGGPVVWLPVSRWGTETESIQLAGGKSASIGVALVSRTLPGAVLSLDQVESRDSEELTARVRRRSSADAPSRTEIISLNRPLRWTAPREPASYTSSFLDIVAPIHWQAAIAGWDEEGPLRAQGGRFVLLSINSSAGVELIAVGGVMIALGSPVALLLKPWLLRRSAVGGVA